MRLTCCNALLNAHRKLPANHMAHVVGCGSLGVFCVYVSELADMRVCCCCCCCSVGVNKGGVAVGLKVGSTSLAFIGSHLAAHQSKTLQRNRGQCLRMPGPNASTRAGIIHDGAQLST